MISNDIMVFISFWPSLRHNSSTMWLKPTGQPILITKKCECKIGKIIQLQTTLKVVILKNMLVVCVENIL
jgi:hypothetical protein